MESKTQSCFGFYFQVVSNFQKGDFADHPVCRFPAALIGGWLCWTPSSPDKVCKSPQPAAMPQFLHLHRGTPSHWQLPSSQDHREGELCQGEAGTTCSDWTRGENLFYKLFGLLLSLVVTCIGVWAGGLCCRINAWLWYFSDCSKSGRKCISGSANDSLICFL